RVRVPEELAVVVRVQVDEARREGKAAGVDFRRATLGGSADGRDFPARHGEVAAAGRRTGAVDEEGVTNDEVGHGSEYLPPSRGDHQSAFRRVGDDALPGKSAGSTWCRSRTRSLSISGARTHRRGSFVLVAMKRRVLIATGLLFIAVAST